MPYLGASFSSPFPSQRPVKSEPSWSQSQSQRSTAFLCENCGCDDIYDGDDGHFYCRECGSMLGHLVVTADAVEDIVGVGGGSDGVGGLYNLRRKINVAPSMSSQPPVKETVTEGDTSPRGREGPVKVEGFGFEDDEDDPIDFGSGSMMDTNTVGNEIAVRYVQGMQLMIQMQCEALIEKFGVNPLICKVVEDIWLRFVASRRLLDGSWADKVIHDSEAALQEQAGEEEPVCRIRSLAEAGPHNMYGHRAIYIWLRALRKAIPLHSSLAISLLSCHIARESVLPTDIVKWALEAKLPYVSAFINIDKLLGRRSKNCPLSSKTMFRPLRVDGAWHLERMVGLIANNIGLRLPPVNFYAIARRFLSELFLPLENILPAACKIYEWSMPAELCFTTDRGMLPTRAYVMAILIITMRMLYNIHGQGVWEKKIASSICSSTNHVPTAENQRENSNCDEIDDYSKFDSSSIRIMKGSEELLRSLEKLFDKMNNEHVPDYISDYSSYLKYCKETICAGIDKPYEEESLMQNLWTIYEDDDLMEDESIANEVGRYGSNSKSDAVDSQGDEKVHIAEGVSFCRQNDPDTVLKLALQKLKRDMEANGFRYLHPKIRGLPEGYYLYYRRRVQFGRKYYVAHADYYVLLRTCAKLCQVDCRVMHTAVLSLEKRLHLLETRILDSLVSLHDGSLESMIERYEAVIDVHSPIEMDSQEPVVGLS